VLSPAEILGGLLNIRNGKGAESTPISQQYECGISFPASRNILMLLHDNLRVSAWVLFFPFAKDLVVCTLSRLKKSSWCHVGVSSWASIRATGAWRESLGHRCGRGGLLLFEWLAAERKEVVVMDKNEHALRQMTDYLGVRILHGSASNPRILEEAGVRVADIIARASGALVLP
jgi:hypothetical protein